MTTTPRIGVVGAGGIGRTHLRAYRDAGVPAVALVDVDPDRAAAAAAEFGVTVYADLAAMLGDASLDAVSICTPPADHLPSALTALAAGVAVLCEKPMAVTPADCELMILAAASAGALLTVGHCHRFQPQVEAMRAAVLEGAIGTVLTFHNRFSGPLDGVESTWFSQRQIAGGGVLMDTCVHSVDLFRYLVGDIAQVRAVTGSTATSRGPAVEVEDTAVLAVRSRDGVLGTIEASWRTAPGVATITLEGSEGRLHLDYPTMTLTLTSDDGTAPTTIEVDDANRFTRQAAHFVACLRGEEQPRVTPHDGAAAVSVLMEAYASAETDQPTTQAEQRMHNR